MNLAAPTLSQHCRDTLLLHLRGEPVGQRADSTASEVSQESDHCRACLSLAGLAGEFSRESARFELTDLSAVG